MTEEQTPYGPAALPTGTYTITMPQTIDVGGRPYNFDRWIDTDVSNTNPLNPIRTIYLNHDAVLTAQYIALYLLSVNSNPENILFDLTYIG
jgi:hypothetical protein